MMGGGKVSRAEFDALARRLDFLDEHGTRGVGVVSSQVTAVSQQLTQLGQAQVDHDRQHVKEREDAIKSRRWRIAMIVAAVAAVDTPALLSFIWIAVFHH